MDEQEWLQRTDPKSMLVFAGGKASERKLRLFGCGCCRRIWQLLDDSRRTMIDEAERIADETIAMPYPRKLIVSVLFEAARHAIAASAVVASINSDDSAKRFAAYAVDGVGSLTGPRSSIDGITIWSAWGAAGRSDFPIDVAARRHQTNLLRDIFGNPFHPTTIDPRWLTSTVVDLASAIYQERTFDRMPILADALMDGGCDSEEIIAHCRGEGPHARGCWVVDLLLGKK